MTEYRIVCTRTIEEPNGKTRKHNALPCIYGGQSHKFETTDKERAERWLKIAQEKCPEFDARTAAEFGKIPGAFRITQTNIRIQTRNVSAWK